MTKYIKIVMGVLAVILVASLALAVMAFVAPDPVRAGPPQPLGWACYGRVCWEWWPGCYDPGNIGKPHLVCTNWCESVPGGQWSCLGDEFCSNSCW